MITRAILLESVIKYKPQNPNYTETAFDELVLTLS